VSWLRDYLEYTLHQESPTDLHFWVGMAVLASVLDRRIWVHKQKMGVQWYKVYPGQLMCVLVTPPGKGHKGAAMRVGRGLMEDLGIHIIKGKGSTEGIIKKIARGPMYVSQTGRIASMAQPDAIACLIAPELSVMLSRQTYAESLIDFLTDIYDADGDFPYTLSQQELILHNPCLTFLAGATPVSIGDSIPEKAHGSGYISRVLHVWHSGVERPYDSLVELLPVDQVKKIKDAKDQIRADLVERLKLLRGLSGEIVFYRDEQETDLYLKAKSNGGGFEPQLDAACWYDYWHDRWKESFEGQGEGYPTRKPDHLLRLATLLMASEMVKQGAVAPLPAPVMTIPLMDAARLALDKLEKGFGHAFACIGQHKQAMLLQEKVLKVLQKYGGTATTRQILGTTIRYFRDVKEYKDVMSTLVDAGLITYLGVKGGSSDEWWEIAKAAP
jgi:hypothetical protein